MAEKKEAFSTGVLKTLKKIATNPKNKVEYKKPSAITDAGYYITHNGKRIFSVTKDKHNSYRLVIKQEAVDFLSEKELEELWHHLSGDGLSVSNAKMVDFLKQYE